MSEPAGFRCFWCLKRFRWQQHTRDHLVPLCMGGTDTPDNLRDACAGCNQSRGLLTSARGNLLAIERKLSAWERLTARQRRALHGVVRRFQGRLAGLLEHQAQWVALEVERLGWSPLAEVELELLW